MPLVLSRKANESIRIGDDVVVTAVACRSGRVQLSVDAPLSVRVLRAELGGGQSRLPESVVSVRDKMMLIAQEWSRHTAGGLDVLASSCLDEMQELICDVRP